MNSKAVISIRVLLALAMALGALLAVTVPALAAPQVDLSLTPASQNTISPTTFTVTIRVTPVDGQPVAGIDVFLDFDPAVLQADSIARAPGSPYNMSLQNIIDNTAGHADYSDMTFAAGPTTAFDLAVVTFHGIAGATNSAITFSTDSDGGRATTAANDGNDVTGTLTQATVTVLVAPTANFTAAGAVSGTTTVTAGETVNFADASGGPPTSWDWDFDTSTPSTDSTIQNPTHVYTVAGTYSVRLTATNDVGSDTLTRNAYITVVPAALDHVTVSPAAPSLVVSGNQTFTAATFDEFDNARTGDPIAWSMANPTAGSIDPSTGVFTAGTAAGVYTNAIVALSGPVTGTASVTVTAGALDHITVSPASPSVAVQGNQTYTAATFDVFDNPRTGDAIVWSVADPAAGSIDPSTGVFTADTLAGTYSDAIVATSGAVTGNASVTVTPGPLDNIRVSPETPSVVVQGNQTFTASTFDQFDNERTGDPIAWSVANATAGSINAATGVLTAGTVAGTYADAVVATSGAVTGDASVTVTPGPLASITVTPPHPTVGITASQTFAAAGFDAFGNARTGDVFTWSVAVAAAGSINASTGVFTATGDIGNVLDYADVIVATSGAVTGTASVNVVGGIIDGTVTLQGGARPALKRIVGVTVKTFATATSNTNLRLGTGALGTYAGTTVDTGSNTVTFQVVGLVPGTYDITIDSGHTLMNVKKNVVISGGNNAVNFGTLLEGDSDDSGQVAAVDFSILASSYLKSTGQAGYDARADYDGTGQVNSLDFSMLAGNYLKTSPQTVA